MKFNIKTSVQFALIFVLFSLPGLLNAQVGTNILLNGDFEQGVSNWTERKCTMTVVDSPVYSGRQAVLVTNRSKIWGGPAQTFTDSLLAYGQGKYVVYGYFRTQSGADTAKIQIKLVVDNVKYYTQINAPIDSLGWTRVQDTIRLTWDTSAVLSETDIYLQTKNDQSLAYYVDNIAIIPDSVAGGSGGGGQEDSTGLEMDDPISPQDFVRMLGKGFDVSWSEFNKYIASYNEQMVKDIKAAGFDHVRLRTSRNADNDLFADLDRQVKDCLKNDVIPIIANQAHEAEDNPTDENRDALIAWWHTVAEHYKNYPHRLAFNLLVEISGELSNQPELLNQWYEMLVDTIRRVSPTRLIIISPVGLSNPYNLPLLRIPSKANGYLLAEWHFYAAGPSKTNEKKRWTTGTPEEKKLITDKIQAALNWQDSTGIFTWVGAWMPGNYNKGDDYTVPEQVRFASFMVRSLEKAGIPWAVNAIHKFYDAESNQWRNDRLPVVDVMVDPYKIALYAQRGNRGAKLRLALGQYDADFLQQNGFLNHIAGVMIPMDFILRTYSQPGFGGTETVYVNSDSDLVAGQDSLPIASLTVEYDSTSTAIDGRNHGLTNPRTLRLKQNFPNPFNPQTTIEYVLPARGTVRFTVFNILGQKVTERILGNQAAGIHRLIWNARDARGRPLPGGIYFYRLQQAGHGLTRKMILVR